LATTDLASAGEQNRLVKAIRFEDHRFGERRRAKSIGQGDSALGHHRFSISAPQALAAICSVVRGIRSARYAWTMHPLITRYLPEISALCQRYRVRRLELFS
jgi:hypothetical protein